MNSALVHSQVIPLAEHNFGVEIQPDVQVVGNPAFNPDAGPALVFQIQLDMAW